MKKSFQLLSYKEEEVLMKDMTIKKIEVTEKNLEVNGELSCKKDCKSYEGNISSIFNCDPKLSKRITDDF